MSDKSSDLRFDAMEDFEFPFDDADDTAYQTYTQVASCAISGAVDRMERRRKSLRAKLEREQFERRKRHVNSLTRTFLNLFRVG